MEEFSSVKELKGVGEKTQKLFEKVGIHVVGDFLNFFPRNYDIFEESLPISQLMAGGVQAAAGTICEAVQIRRIRNLQIVTTAIRDDTGILKLTWFNMPFLRSILRKGSRYIFRGRVLKKQNRLVMEQPKYYTIAEYEELLHQMQPIYSLTAGLSNNMIVKCVKQILEEKGLMQEYLPEDMLKRQGLMTYREAIEKIHFPQNLEEMHGARKRLVFDEFFLFILSLRQLKETKEQSRNDFIIKDGEWETNVLKSLSFSLTNAQKKVLGEIRQDMKKQVSMARLIQGDVGSGKSIVAILSLFMAAESGYQGALMAPTEVLARQHLASIEELIRNAGLPVKAALLTGSTKGAERREIYEGLANGDIQIVVGTHALIQEKVEYRNLALVITDEQHRFGVKQRERLSKKGNNPHVLVMSATPIPRTLAVILYGDLDISVINELPANRIPIKNCVVDTSYREKAYRFIEKEVAAGRQAYVICAMVEESENMDEENVIEYSEILREKLHSSIVVEYLHGKMKSEEKQLIMERFAENKIQVLVSTTVIEVGINVPNATVMMIENAERFGLAQLHQLRGRVGRGKHQSYCIMVRGSDDEDVRKRLEILNKSTDGFFIASEDLRLRGPGDLFGIRQSGDLSFKIGDVFQDGEILQKASKEANTLLAADPELALPENHALRDKQAAYDTYMLERVNL